jgi:hypothetical protein
MGGGKGEAGASYFAQHGVFGIGDIMRVCVCLVHAEIDSALNSTSTVHLRRLWLLVRLPIPCLWFLKEDPHWS